MGTVLQASPERMYSWWWDSHISPKNSKWLQENLTDMDAKVKQMIKLIEEDADSFARRAEMYYKKRPELMKLVEEFYRAYRALAERYDHVTGVLRQAHPTMANAFPNQVPFALMDDFPAGLPTEVYPDSPDMSQIGVTFDLCKMQKDVMPLSPPDFHADQGNGALFGVSDSKDGTNCMKSVERRVRKALNFQDADIKELEEPNSVIDNLKAQVSSESERVDKAELEISTLKSALSKLEAEREAGLLEYQKSLERLSNLEVEVSRAEKDSKGLNERSSKAEAEVRTLKNSLDKLEAERRASLLQYQQCADKISNMENFISQSQKTVGELDERASKAETEAQSLTHGLARLEAEKESSLVMYNQCLKKISDMEGKLQHAKDTARRSNERADKADNEVQTLMQALSRLVVEKETAAVKYSNCLETIAFLEHKLTVAQEDAKRLNSRIDDGVAKFKGAEERCLQLEITNLTMKYSLESLTQKMAAQSEELTEKQKEMSKLWTNLQEERLRFMEADNSLRTLQRLHSESQEVFQSISLELQKRGSKLEDLEAMNWSLQQEVGQTKVQNKSLNEVNLSLALTVQDLKAEILCLKEKIVKLEAEVEVRLDQRTALQQEIHGLKEEQNCLNMSHRALMEQVESLDFGPDGFVSCKKELQDENIKLKRVSGKEREEKVVFLDTLAGVDMHIKKNGNLEESLSKLNVELEGVRGKVKELADSCISLQEEKSTLVSKKSLSASQLLAATVDLENLSEKKICLEKSLLEANSELEGLRSTSKCCEESGPSQGRTNSRDVEINQLKERVYALDVENGELKAQMIAYATAFFSLRDCVTTLEHISTLQVLHEIDAKEAKDAVSATCDESHQQMSEQQDAMLQIGFLDLKGLQTRIKDIEKAMIEKDEHLLLEISMASSKLEAAMRQIEDLKSTSCVNCQHVRKGKNIDHKLEDEQLTKGSSKDVRMQKETHGISKEGSEVRTKDIILDETSECSSVGFSRRDSTEANNPTFEVWKTAFRNGSIDMTVEKAQKVTRTWADKKHFREHRIRKKQSFAESENSGRFSSSLHLVNERRIQERLDSDAQKLTNLLITVQDLKKTVELTERSKKGKDTEYDIVKEKLDESEEAITKLFNASLRLKRTVQDESLSENSAIELDEGGSIRRRKISEQARRVSEKVGRLQLEVQKLQFLLLKLDDHNKTRPRIKLAERKTRVLLRDYLNSQTRTRQRPTKGHFCACAQPSTRED